MITITLPDGSRHEFPPGVTVREVAEALDSPRGEDCWGAVADGEYVDLRAPLHQDCQLRLIHTEDPESLDVLRHSTSHVMATAVKRLWPAARVGIGPWIEDGFYYDFDFPEPISDEDLPSIEREMRKIIKEDVPFQRCEVEKPAALKRFEAEQEPYKQELAEGLEEGEISTFRNGEFEDLCRGPHIRSTGDIRAFKVLKLAGAYWRGDAERPQLTRIYGTAWHSKEDLQQYLARLEEARKRDHRLLGKQLELFSFNPHSPGSVFMHPAGMVVWNGLLEMMRAELQKRGYGEVMTPVLLDRSLWVRSGHWEKFRDKMYFVSEPGVEGDPEVGIKPMNCPGGILIYQSSHHSYRDFPLRLAEFGLVHRKEQSGELHGLARVRSFVQDDAHHFCTPEQIEDEVVELMDLIDLVYRRTFGLDYAVELSTRPEVFQGEIADWDRAEAALQGALEREQVKYKLNPGEGAFYGPKIDFIIKDCLGRSWQCGTIQLDFTLPERFDLTYTAADNTRQRTVMIHRAIFGSVERFYMILLEHLAGAFPVWLAPEQVRIVAIGEAHHEYARQLEAQLREHQLRAEADLRSESMGFKIREAAKRKIPYVLVVGDREREAGTVNVRMRGNRRLGELSVTAFLERILEEVRTRALDGIGD